MDCFNSFIHRDLSKMNSLTNCFTNVASNAMQNNGLVFEKVYLQYKAKTSVYLLTESTACVFHRLAMFCSTKELDVCVLVILTKVIFCSSRLISNFFWAFLFRIHKAQGIIAVHRVFVLSQPNCISFS